MKPSNISSDKSLNINGEFSGLNFIQLLYKYSELYEVVSKSKEDRLSPKERQFFVMCVLYILNSKSLEDVSVKKEISKNMGFSSYRSIYQYIDKLVDKGWIIKSKKNIKLIPDFKLPLDLEGIKFCVTLKANK